ncbi:MAG: single-stranded DNA-binding protein [Chitinophagales bacterium]|nr:single-stranded DNA-binding protein [Chitinophagales bacterium]
MNNNVTITGNLTADPEIKYFDSGAVKTTFSIAVTRTWKDNNGEKQEQTSFVDVHAWRYLAEDIARTLSKGSRVTVNGRIEQQSWEDKTDGSKRSKIVVVADDVSVAISQIESYERRKRAEGGEGQSQGQVRSQGAQKASGAASRSSGARVPAAAGARKPATSREELEADEPF